MFGLLKFATMLKNSPNLGTGTVTVKNDPRVLPMGGFLRKTKINELPLINILKGDMSIVGPRPQISAASMRLEGIADRDHEGVAGALGIGSIFFR